MRYFGSFFIALFLYGTLVFAAIYTSSQTTLAPLSMEKVQVVKVALVEAKVKKEIESLKSVKKQEKPKKKIEKKKKELKTEEKQEKKIKKKIVKKKIEKPIEKDYCEIEDTPKKTQEKTITKKPLTAQKSFSKTNVDLIKKRFFLKLKEDINQNKTYPLVARKRGIQGSVKIRFTISKDGSLADLKILEGKSIFKKAVFTAVKKSFPRKIKEKIDFLPISAELEIKFKLNK